MIDPNGAQSNMLSGSVNAGGKTLVATDTASVNEWINTSFKVAGFITNANTLFTNGNPTQGLIVRATLEY